MNYVYLHPSNQKLKTKDNHDILTYLIVFKNKVCFFALFSEKRQNNFKNNEYLAKCIIVNQRRLKKLKEFQILIVTA